MNFFKKAILTLTVVIGLLSLVSFFLPSKLHVERTLTIGAGSTTVFNQVNTLKNWQNWSHWDQMDPDMISTYEGPESGAGATHSWSSKHRSVGTGSMTIVESAEPDSISTSLSFGGTVSRGGWIFKTGQGGTMTTVYIDMEFPFFGRIFPGLMMNEWLAKDFDKALEGLKSYCENLPTEENPSWHIEIITTTETPALSIHINASQSDFSARLGESNGKIMEAMGKQGLRQAGPVYAIYYKWSMDTVELEPGIPVDKPGKSDGDINAVTLPSQQAMKLDYYGNYPGTEKAHYFMDKWATTNHITIAGPPWEEYVTDPMMEPDTAKWLTRIYYPVSRPSVPR